MSYLSLLFYTFSRTAGCGSSLSGSSSESPLQKCLYVAISSGTFVMKRFCTPLVLSGCFILHIKHNLNKESKTALKYP